MYLSFNEEEEEEKRIPNSVHFDMYIACSVETVLFLASLYLQTKRKNAAFKITRNN
jgi:hypothetical protein